MNDKRENSKGIVPAYSIPVFGISNFGVRIKPYKMSFSFTATTRGIRVPLVAKKKNCGV